MRTVTRAFLRYLVRRRHLTALQILGIACGVAAVTGMALSARAALDGVSRAERFLGGRSTHSLSRPAGPLEEMVLPALMRDPAVASFAPVISRRVTLAGGEPARLLGVDPFLDREIRPGLAAVSLSREQGLALLTRARTVLVSESLARRRALVPGSTLPTDRGELTVLGIFPDPTGEPLLLMDIGNAQELFGLRGRLDRVDLAVRDEKGLTARWSQGFLLQAVGERESSLRNLLSAFRLNIQALSLLALLVGVFLVYNTAMFAVVSRRRDAGILLSLGATRGEVAVSFLAEILLLGGAGGLLGGALGFLLSRLLTDILGGTVSRLYFFLSPAPPPWSWGILASGAVLGALAALAGGFSPLAELARTDPAAILHGRVPRRESAARARRAAWAGLALAAASTALLPLASLDIYLGFAGAFGLLMGLSLVSGWALVRLHPALRRFLWFLGGLPGKVAAGNIRQNLGRTAVATAAFTVALSMSVGMGSMIGSFRRTLLWWMDTQILGDAYVAPGLDEEAPAELYPEVLAVPGVAAVDRYRNTPFPYRGAIIRLSAVDAPVLRRFTRFGWLAGDDRHWDEVARGAVVVSEAFSRRFGVKAGDRVRLEAREGAADLPVAAVYYDYTSEQGMVMMDRSTYSRLFRDDTIDTLAVWVTPGHPHPEQVLEEVRRVAARRGVGMEERGPFRERILALFDATFAVTRSMRVLAILTAFFGIAGALLTLYLERQRDFGVYRALGFTLREVVGVTVLEGLGMGLVSFLLAAAGGTMVAVVLIRVINLQSFHWTIFWHPQPAPYLLALGTALLASVGAAVYPSWRVVRTYPQMQIREE